MFQYMDNLYFNSYDQFINEVDMARAGMLDVDKSEVSQDPIVLDLDKVSHLPNGRWDTEFKNVKFECFFHQKEKKKLYVFMNGAITWKSATIPSFARWTYYKFIDGSMINISDPMYRMYEQLKLGWYYGNEKFDLRQVVAEFVLAIANILDIENNNIIFVGSSGGGPAAIASAYYISGAGSIIINPQIILHEYGYSERFAEITEIDLTGEDQYHRNDTIYYLQHNRNNFHCLFVNLRSQIDMRQVKNICDRMEIRVKYGLNVFDNLVIWLYDADLMPYVSHHSLQENYCIWFGIEFVMTQRNYIEDLKKHDDLFRLINEFYYDRRKSEKEWRGRVPDISRLWQCEHMNRKVAIFGCGKKADFLNEDLFCIEEVNYFHIEFVIDNDEEKKYREYHGLPIRHPADIEDWKELFIVITSEKYHDQIRRQLEKKGLVYQRDFISYYDLYR